MSETRGHIPKRTCLGCNQIKEKYSLIRFIIKPETKHLIIDPSQTEHGRGNYICPDWNCLSGLQKSKKFKKLLSSTSPGNKKEFLQQLEKIMQPDKIFSLTGLAKRAGKLAVGARAVEAVLKKRQAKLVILSGDAAQNTQDRFVHLTENVKIELIIYGKKEHWGNLLGRESTAVIAILNDHFAKAIMDEYNALDKQREKSH